MVVAIRVACIFTYIHVFSMVVRVYVCIYIFIFASRLLADPLFSPFSVLLSGKSFGIPAPSYHRVQPGAMSSFGPDGNRPITLSSHLLPALPLSFCSLSDDISLALLTVSLLLFRVFPDHPVYCRAAYVSSGSGISYPPERMKSVTPRQCISASALTR